MNTTGMHSKTPAPQNIAIIGAGIIGLLTAWRCAQAGHKVTVFEQDKILARMGNTGCSAYSLGSLVPYTPTRQHDLAQFQRASLKLWPNIAAELKAATGINIGYNTLGRVQLLTTAGKRESAAQDLALNPSQGRLLTQAEISTAYPYIAPDSAPHGAFFCRDSAYLNVPATLQALLKATQQENVTFRTNTRTTAAELLPTHDHIIIAAGTGSTHALGKFATPETATTPMYGHGIALEIPPAVLATLPVALPLIRQGEFYACHHGNTVVIGSDTTNPATEITENTPHATPRHHTLPNDTLTQHLRHTAHTILPHLAHACTTALWRAGRPKSLNRAQPIRTITPQITLATGHYKIGFCLAPKVAQDIKQLIEK